MRTERSPQPSNPRDAVEHRALAWSLAGLCLLLTSTRLPFVSAEKFGQGNDGRMFSGAVSLWQQGQGALATLVALCGFLVPLALLLVLAAAALSPAWRPHLHRWARRLESWSMPEVRVLAIVVAFTKLSALVTAVPAAGLWCYGAAAVCTLLAARGLGHPPAPGADPIRRTAAPAALGLGAAVLLVPAYTLPVMSFAKIGQAHADTLFASVAKLWHAHLWGIAAIVFTASIVVPLLKLIALAALLRAARQRPRRTDGWQRLHSLVHGIGRWSMLDVFLVAFLCGIVDFGDFAQIEARPGVLAFAGAVVLTMLATASFDPRLLAPQRGDEPPASPSPS